MYRCLILLMAAILIPTLNSCNKPAATETDSVSQHGVFLKDMGNGVCRQFPTGLMWQIEKSKVISNWHQANEYAKKLQLGGFDDWRLPTREECFALSHLLLMKKGDCPIKIKKGKWVTDNKKGRSGFWDDYLLCGGPELRWIKTQDGSVYAVRP